MYSSDDRTIVTLLLVATIGCGSRSALDVVSTEQNDGGFEGDVSEWPDACLTPDNRYAVCDGTHACFPPETRVEDAACVACLADPADPSAVGICLAHSNHAGVTVTPGAGVFAADGDLYVAGDPSFPSAWAVYPYEVGELFSNSGGSDRVRYADWTPWSGDPLPLPTSCPTFSGFRICGGNCGICKTNETCTGRSPSHPYGLCVTSSGCGKRPDGLGWYPCPDGNECLVFDAGAANQALADVNGSCFPTASCEEAAGSFPGAVMCHANP